MPQPDLAGLAMLARIGDRELRPVLLTFHTREFVSAPSRDRKTVATYEALALGLIPLVPDDVVADVAAMLRQVPEAPPRVMELLAERRQARSVPDPIQQARSANLTAPAAAELLTAANRDIDLALARNAAAPLDANARRILVERAIADRELAQALLARADLSSCERGSLFAHAADAADRDLIREELEGATAVAAGSDVSPLSDWRRGRLLRAAAKADLPGLLDEIGRTLGLAQAPAWQLDREVDAELFALSLVAVGLTVDDCIRVLLTADHRIASSVPAVFRLRQVCRTTSRAAACLILGAEATPRKRRGGSSGAGRTTRSDGARALLATQPARQSKAGRGSGPADRRSRSTTGPDRT